MKPVAVLQFFSQDGPGFLDCHLRARGIPMRVFRLCDGERAPGSLAFFSGLSMLGGPMSVNDDWDALRETEGLIREAVRNDMPVLGHCLGGQLMSTAFGGRVTRAPNSEIGWSRIDAAATSSARAWFGAEHFPQFQWHHEVFSLPPGAELIASGEHCRNQAYALGALHVGMQFHIEIDAAKIDAWLNDDGDREIADHADSPGVQDAAAIRAGTATHLAASQRVAAHLYDRWLEGLRR
jgi:GMP synthase-like glutamine amidotransferase